MYEDGTSMDTFDDDDDENEWKSPLDEPVPSASGYQATQHIKIPISDASTFTSKLNHSRTIIHIDIDCFYAQVEMIRNPQLREQPLGIQQKYIVVTCNYKAREYGVTKLMTIKDAKEKCPQLILVNGEDLKHYREMSYRISEFLQKYVQNVERLGFDENFLDVSEMVTQKLNSGDCQKKVKGHTYLKTEEDQQTAPCNCGCYERLIVGSEIANDIRSSLYDELEITCCAGISYNKLLAKLVGEQHKPNQQTTLFPNQTEAFMSSMKKATKIPGIGSTMSKKLAKLSVVSVNDLQTIPLSDLEPELGEAQAVTIKQLSYGIDDTPVVPYGRPQTLSDEDSFRNCCSMPQVKSKASQLLKSLLLRLHEDGRLVQTIRLSIRKLLTENKWSNRESRQCPVPHHIALKISQGKTHAMLPELEKLTIGLFTKLVDTSNPFHLTLMNIAFCNLIEKPKNSIQNFLSPKKSKAIESSCVEQDVDNTKQHSAASVKNTGNVAEKVIMKFFKSGPQNNERVCEDKGVSETSERKRKSGNNFFHPATKKTKGKDINSEQCLEPVANNNGYSIDNIDKDVFNQLPSDIQKEIVQTKAFVGSNNGTVKITETDCSQNTKHQNDVDDRTNMLCENGELKEKLKKAGIDLNDFLTFPEEIQKDVLQQYNISSKQTSNKEKRKSILSYFTPKDPG